MKPLAIGALSVLLAQGAVVVDRIAAVVGNRVIKQSDIEREVRMTSFLNSQPVDLSARARRAAAERLVDQQLIRQELASQGYGRASNEDADALRTQILSDRFRGSASAMQTALRNYGLTEGAFQNQLVWQLTVLHFIDERFRPGVMVTDAEIEDYYEKHRAEIQKESPKAFDLESVTPRIKTVLEGQRIDEQFEAWLAETKKQNRIEYKEAAFQ
jgi:hypothetical protein